LVRRSHCRDKYYDELPNNAVNAFAFVITGMISVVDCEMEEALAAMNQWL
jgi:hypothetical protein